MLKLCVWVLLLLPIPDKTMVMVKRQKNSVGDGIQTTVSSNESTLTYSLTAKNNNITLVSHYGKRSLIRKM